MQVRYVWQRADLDLFMLNTEKYVGLSFSVPEPVRGFGAATGKNNGHSNSLYEAAMQLEG